MHCLVQGLLTGTERVTCQTEVASRGGELAQNLSGDEKQELAALWMNPEDS